MIMLHQRLETPTLVPGVLVVDDEALVRRVVCRRLQMDGFRVWEARNGAEAVEFYRAFRDEIQLVLLDVRMPEMDGPGTLREIRELNPKAVVCFLTGHSERYSEEELRQLGAARVFLKGAVDWDGLTNILREAGPSG
jgi:CheY-like chemotaxis protein